MTETSFDYHFDFAIFCAGGDVSKKFAPIAVSKGCIVIDNSSAFRMEPDVPLVVPEVNPDVIKNHHGIIANPNCSTIQAMPVLKPLEDNYKIKRIIYSTYQAVSGAGQKGINDLENGRRNPSLMILRKVAIALDIDLSELFIGIRDYSLSNDYNKIK